MKPSEEQMFALEEDSLAWAMEVLTGKAEILGSERLIPVSSVHIPDWDTAERRELLAQLSHPAVPTSLNPGRPLSDTASVHFKARSCAPYLCGQNVSKGTVVAWGGRAACAFVNSALDARSGIESFETALASAIVGLTPERPLHTERGRRPSVAVDLDVELDDLFRLGDGLSREMDGEVPLVCGKGIGMGGFKALCFAANRRNGVPLIRYTRKDPPRNLEVIPASELVPRTSDRDDADLLILGCPHLSEQEVNLWARTLVDHRPGVETWSFLPKLCADKSPKTGDVLRARGRMFLDRCPASLADEMRGRRVACLSPALVECLAERGVDAFWTDPSTAEKMMIEKGL